MKKRMTASLKQIYPQDQSGAFTQSLMELGATVCLPSGMPKCDICPVAELCSAFKNNSVLDFPVKQEKKARSVQKLTVFVLSCQGALAIRRREKAGLLAGLWELPNVYKELDEQHVFELAAQWGAAPVSVTKSVRRTHVFTHIKWDMTCYYLDCAEQPSRFIWADHVALFETYALPTAFKMFLK